MAGIFDGVRVLSLAEQYPGPFATMLLADLGADVVLVERPKGGDPARAFPPFFRGLARNKRSICLDLKEPAGRADLLALVAHADVVLEGFRPGTMDRLGVGYEAMKASNPKIVYASISGFGQNGPYRDRTAHDLSYQAVSGLLFAHDGPLPTISYADLGGAMFAAFAIASALFARERTGLGTSIDVSMTDGLVSWMTAYLSPAMANQPALESMLEEPAYGMFTTGDGRKLTLSIAHEDHFWRALCPLVGLDDAATLDHHARLAQTGALTNRLRTALGAQPLAHWAALFDRHAIPWSPLNDLKDVLADPHFRARGLFTDGHVMQPVQFSSWSSELRRPSPELGEHTSEVLDAWRSAAQK